MSLLMSILILMFGRMDLDTLPHGTGMGSYIVII